MGPRERALYLKKSKSLAVQSEEEIGSTLAGATPTSLRSWLRQVFGDIIIIINMMTCAPVTDMWGLHICMCSLLRCTWHLV
jgi:hypothetical protein